MHEHMPCGILRQLRYFATIDPNSSNKNMTVAAVVWMTYVCLCWSVLIRAMSKVRKSTNIMAILSVNLSGITRFQLEGIS
jgi:hypothetical protein